MAWHMKLLALGLQRRRLRRQQKHSNRASGGARVMCGDGVHMVARADRSEAQGKCAHLVLYYIYLVVPMM